MKIFNEKAEALTKRYICDNYTKINVISGACRYNYKCQMNAVHEAMKRNQKYVVMSVYIEHTNGAAIIHFLNVDKNDNYYDNTLGQWSTFHNYYLIRVIYATEFYKINDIFLKYRRYLRSRLPFHIRILSDIEN